MFKVQCLCLLHGETVKRAMLFNHRCSIYRNDVTVGKGRPNDVECLLIQFVLLISWNYHRPINDNEVGVSGWQTLTLVENRLGYSCLLYTSPSPRDKRQSRMPSSA